MTESFRPTVLRSKGWAALQDKWGNAALASLMLYAVALAGGIVTGLVSVILGSISVKLGTLIYILGLFALTFASMLCAVGLIYIFWDVLKGGRVEFNTIFEPLKDWRRYLTAVVLVFVYTFLWSLLLYIPGIIKGLSYSQTYFIMRENPEMSGEQAIQQSMKMMHGHKMDLFLLGLSFIGWILLGVITLGIGYLWIYPYVYTTFAAFYEELKEDYETRIA